MRRHPFTQFVGARHHIQHARRKHITQQGRDLEGAQWCIGGWLQHHGVAGVKRRDQGTGGQIDRSIPGRDDADHPEREILQFDAPLGIVLQHFIGDDDVGHSDGLCGRTSDLIARLPQRFSRFQGEQLGQRGGIVGENLRHAADGARRSATAVARQAGNARRGSHGPVELRAAQKRRTGESLAGRRIHHVKPLFPAEHFAIDEIGEIRAQLRSSSAGMVGGGLGVHGGEISGDCVRWAARLRYQITRRRSHT